MRKPALNLSQSQSGNLSILGIIFLLIGLAVAVFLVKQSQHLKSRADNDLILIKSASGEDLQVEEGLKVTSSRSVKITIDAPPAP